MPDRYGEEPEDTKPPRFHDPRCQSGWLGENLDGRPVPCLQCRPHLARTADVHDCSARERR